MRAFVIKLSHEPKQFYEKYEQKKYKAAINDVKYNKSGHHLSSITFS